MKLVLVNNYLYYRGGAEKVFLDQKELFQHKGHQVFLFGQNHPDNLPDANQDWFPIWSDPKKAGFINGLPRLLKFTYSSENRRIFRKFLRHFQPDLVHVHNLYGGLTTAVLDAAADMNVPVVLTLHDYKMISLSPNLLSGIDPCRDCLVKPGTIKCVFRRCHRGSLKSTLAYYCETWFNTRCRKYDSVKTFIVPSHFMMKTILEFGLDPDRIQVVPNTLPEEEKVPGNRRGNYFFYGARMTDEKGVPTLLESFKGISEELVLAGDGPQLGKYQRLVEGRKNIRFTGHLSSAQMNEHYRDCLAVVVPSLWPETSSMTTLQAMSCAKPVVASRIGALTELIEDGVTGFLFEPGNSEQLAGILRRLASESGLAERIGSQAREAFEERFSQEGQYQTLMGIYERVLGNGK